MADHFEILKTSGKGLIGKTDSRLKISRDFDAPREKVWRAWTMPGAIVRWLGPRDWPATEVSADLRVGGAWRACLKSKTTDEKLWQSGHYLVLQPHEHLEFTFAWEGSNHEDGPGVRTHVVILLEALATGSTRMHFNQTGLVSSDSVSGHAGGWNSTFDRLTDFLDDTA